ncbi:MAG TPA: L-lactate dehydrogenase [Clostridia bacterium]|nr:L-lactate dehydrogenase [Clostridia bacterium]
MANRGNKVAIVGAGQVGSTCAYTLLLSGLVSELVLIDLNEKRVRGEVLDLSHGTPLCPPAEIVAGQYPDCKDADIVILAAGVSQRPGETRMDLVRRNAKVFESIVPQVVRYAPEAILLVVTNPVDVLTYVTSRLSGLPAGRVIGSGTVLDTSRLRFLLSRHTQVDPRNIHTYVLGEHGDSELPAWSLTSIAGMTMDEYCGLCNRCESRLSEVVRAQFDEQVRNVAYEIIEAKGATYYAVALAVRRICEAILRDEQAILTVSSVLDGQYGLSGLALSLPVVLGRQGVREVLPIHLDAEEMEKLNLSAAAIRTAVEQTGID